jgi:hypothetical protein
MKMMLMAEYDTGRPEKTRKTEISEVVNDWDRRSEAMEVRGPRDLEGHDEARWKRNKTKIHMRSIKQSESEY